MKTSRRAFLKKGTLAVTGTLLLPNLLWASENKKAKLGIQLWTVRSDMKKDPAATLKKIAAIGYKNIEHAGYGDRKFYGYTPADFRKLLSGLGLDMFSGHVDFGMKDWDPVEKDFSGHWKYTVEDALTAGQQYLITPALNEAAQKDEDRLKRLLELFNKCGAFCKNKGLKFGYHTDFSHNSLLKKERLYDIILKNTDPKLVLQEFDIGNMYSALQNTDQSVMDILKENLGRFPLFHVKDEFKVNSRGEMNNGYDSIVLGKGVVPLKEILDYAGKHNDVKYFIIEQESYQGIPPLQCAKEDYQVMKKWGY